jgi:unsaturated rhamnogalacturonyl hydrolase
MMFSVFPMRFAKENADNELLDFAARQPRLYAEYMQDNKEHLWFHSYWVKAGRPHPKNLFWGRGNGWVICALPMILQYMPENHKERSEIIQIFKSTSEALVPYQRPDGYFETIINRPGKTYREASATALIAAGWFEGARNGWLPEEYGDYAMKAYKQLINNLIFRNGEVFLPEISGPTIPLQVLPYMGYKLIPTRENWSYGVAAMIFCGIACDKWLNSGKD